MWFATGLSTCEVHVKIRVYELAKELGVESTRLLDHCRSTGVFISSASSQLSSAEEATLRDWANTQPSDALPTTPHLAGHRHAMPALPLVGVDWSRPRSPRGKRHRGAIAPMTQLMLDRHLLCRQDYRDHGAPFLDEVVRADRLAQEWAEVWFDVKQARAWLNAHPSIQAAVAAAFSRVGITPDQASERIWYGKRDQAKPNLADRVGCGDLTAERALEELRAMTANGSGDGGNGCRSPGQR